MHAGRWCSRAPVEGPVAVQPARRRVPRRDSALRVIDGERVVVVDLPMTRDNSHGSLEHRGKSAEWHLFAKALQRTLSMASQLQEPLG